jgi:RHS repeat-associated protein
VTSTAIAPGPVNEAASVGTTAFSYDANGNLLQDASRSYTWDAENRLLSISGSGYTSTFGYDGLGRRVAVNDSGVVTHLGWCGQTLCQKRDGLDNVIRRYFDEGEADLTDNTLLYEGVDHLGSVRDVIALPGGVRTNHFDYNPYGNATTTLGSALTATDFRYAGLFYHQPSGLYLATRRAYDPIIGRWLSRDPLGESGGLNLYEYVSNNPVALTDRQGTEIDDCKEGDCPPAPPTDNPNWRPDSKQRFWASIPRLVTHPGQTCFEMQVGARYLHCCYKDGQPVYGSGGSAWEDWDPNSLWQFPGHFGEWIQNHYSSNPQ